MNGVHDMGGMHGFGVVEPGTDSGSFHADWERHALALTVAMGATGQWNLDQSRHARESLPPAQYLASSYFQIWLAALQRLLLARGLVTEEELATGHAQHPARHAVRVLRAGDVNAALARGAPTARPSIEPARFHPGDRVRARRMHPSGHTRLPRYVRGCVGEIVAAHGAHVFPDRHALAGPPPFEEAPQWLYTVRFDGQALWGADAEPDTSVCVDAWASYLEPLQASA